MLQYFSFFQHKQDTLLTPFLRTDRRSPLITALLLMLCSGLNVSISANGEWINNFALHNPAKHELTAWHPLYRVASSTDPQVSLVNTGELNDANGDGCVDVGETITYTYTVTTPGDISLTDVIMEDYLFRAPNLFVELTFQGGDTDADEELDPDETWTYRAVYTITQADIDRGRVDNQGRVTALAPGEALHSALWGENGELWDPDGPLRDITDVGYMEGDVPIPDWPVGVNVLDFGAVGDGVHDDTQAFRDAIAACPDSTAVFVPNGRYKITDWIKVDDQDYFVLRGEDTYGTVLWFPHNLSEVRPENGYVHAKGGGFFYMHGGTHRSIENFTFEFREEQHLGHFSGTGANGIFYDAGVRDSWIRNIYVRNANLGIRVNGINVTVSNIILDQYEGRSMGQFNWVGHYGLVLSGGRRCLAHNVLVTGRWAHPFSTHSAGQHNVFSHITSLVWAEITHKSISDNNNTWTDIDLGSGINLKPAPKTMYWNIRGGNNMIYPDTSRHCVAVGIKTNAPGSIGANHWHETISQDSLYPQNIYLAQMKFSGKPLPESTLRLPPAWPAPNPSVAEPTDDSYIWIHDPDGTNGHRQYMILQNPNGNLVTRPYLKFALQESVLDNVQRAVLRLYLKENRNDAVSVMVSGTEDDSWTEDSITFNNRPVDGISIDTTTIIEPGWYEWDVTSYVNEQLTGDRTVSLYLTNISATTPRIFFHTREENFGRPELILTPNDDAPPQPPLAPDVPGPSTVVTDLSGSTPANDDFTSIALCQNPVIALLSSGTFNDENGDGIAQVNETVTFRYPVTNLGNVTLANVTITDPLVSVTGDPLVSLAPGATDSTTFSATYVLTPEDITNGFVVNQATGRGEDTNGVPLTDLSDDDDNTQDDMTVTPLPTTALPVELIDFTATLRGKHVLLEWRTASEHENRGFNVQRRLADEVDFQTIGWVAGAGRSQETTDYELTDSDLPAGSLAYYQLAQVDNDGTVTLSDIRSVQLPEAGFSFSVFPNPVSAGLVTVAAPDGELQTLSLHDLWGRKVLETSTPNFNVSNLPAGTYYLKVTLGNGEAGFTKLVVRR